MRGIVRTGARSPVTGSRSYRAGDVTRSNAGGRGRGGSVNVARGGGGSSGS
jgi:hypothetical protein